MGHRFSCPSTRRLARGLAGMLSLGLAAIACSVQAQPALRYWICGNGNWADGACWSDIEAGPPIGVPPMPGTSAIVGMYDTGVDRTVVFDATSTMPGPIDALALINWSTVPASLTLQINDGLFTADLLRVSSLGFGAATVRQNGGQVQVTGSALDVGLPISQGATAPTSSLYELRNGVLIAPLVKVYGRNDAPGLMVHSGGLGLVDVVQVAGGGGVDAARYLLQGSAVLNAGSLVVGLSGAGRFDQAGGTALLGTVSVGNRLPGDSPGNGVFTLGAGTLQATSVFIGDNGSGRFEQSGGQAQVSGLLSLARVPGSSGSYTLLDGTLHSGAVQVGFAGQGSFAQRAGEHVVAGDLVLAGLPNSRGSYELSGGRLSVGGNLIGGAGSQLILSGGELSVAGTVSVAQFDIRANSAVGGRIIVTAGQSLSVAGDATVLFSGPVELQAGALLSGGGTKVFEGGLALGLGEVTRLEDPGSVRMGVGNRTTVEIAGPGGQHDHLAMRGSFSAGGVLVLNLIAYAPQSGERFDLFDWDSVDGSFSSVRLDGAALAPGLYWDLSSLYSTGEVAVATVPETPGWALLLAGMAWIARRARTAPVRTL